MIMSLIYLPPSIRQKLFHHVIQNSIRPLFQNLLFSTTSATFQTKQRSYEDALLLLNSLQSNQNVVSKISKSSHDLNQNAIPEMLEWTQTAGYKVDDFSKYGLRCIHVAGTKGKGSVCMMTESILRQYRHNNASMTEKQAESNRRSLGKIGLYTSPHLVTVRERIRLDGSSISKDLFTRYFFELWDRLSSRTQSPLTHLTSSESKPNYFRYLTLLAFHTFIREGVESAIIECGIGGEYDSTNILPPEAVTVSAITRLGIDHVEMLGDSIGDIAWHKSGIMKNGVPAFASKQPRDAEDVLKRVATERGVSLTAVERHPDIDSGSIKLGLEGEFQKDNASLATAVVHSHLRTLKISPDLLPIERRQSLPPQFIFGLETVTYPGRCFVLKQGKITCLIDGAHTLDSIEATANWYAERLNQEKSPHTTILIFNQQTRAHKPLLEKLITTVANKQTPEAAKLRFVPGKVFDYAVFCSNTAFESELTGGAFSLSQYVPRETAIDYRSIDKGANVFASGSIEAAVGSLDWIVDKAKKQGGGAQIMVLVTGSLYLAGGLLKVLIKQAKESGDMSGLDDIEAD